MNLKGIRLLRCPICSGELGLRSIIPSSDPHESDAFKEYSHDVTIMEGLLFCRFCMVWFPIYNGVAVMLVFTTEMHLWFAERNASIVNEYRGFTSPSLLPKPGELQIQKSFTEEWEALEEGDLHFGYTIEEWTEIYRRVYLRFDERQLTKINSILDAGCGNGTSTIALHELVSDAEVFGIDLSFSLLKKGNAIHKFPNVHFAIASIFYPPFECESFDLVCSIGVLHHTHSTKEAFRNIASIVRPKGYLTICVYALEEYLKNNGFIAILGKLMYFAVESIFRPVLANMPYRGRKLVVLMVSIVLHNSYAKKNNEIISWGFRNTKHAVRDWLTPRYAHRHSFNDVIEWFEELKFDYTVQSPAAYRSITGHPLKHIGLTGLKLRESTKP